MAILIKNGHVKTMAGPDLDGGDVLIEDGRISAVGVGLRCPGAEVIDAAGRLVTPGFVEAHCHVGLDDECCGWEGKDYNESFDPCTPQMRAIDAFYPQDEALMNAVRAGVTTAVTGPGSANVIGGTFIAVKLFGDRVDNMVIKNPAAMKVAFGENAKRCYGQMAKKSPGTRMAIAALLRETLFRARNYMEAKESGNPPPFDMKLEAMVPVLKREIPLKAHAHRADDIFTAIRIAREFNVDITLDHCTDGALIVDELKKENLPAFVGPSLGAKSKIELKNKSFETAGILSRAGIKVSIITDAPVIPLQYLPLCAGLAVKDGMDMEEAWRAITINPAQSTGIGSRVGSLEPGKDGDVVIFDGNPLTDIGAAAACVIMDGRVVHRR